MTEIVGADLREDLEVAVSGPEQGNPSSSTPESPAVSLHPETQPETSSPLHDLLDSARERLIGLDGRTPLLNYKPSRSRGVSIAGESPEALYEILVEQEKHMYFDGTVAESSEDPSTPEQSTPSDSEADLEQPPLTEAQIRDNRINTPHPDSELQTRLVKTANQARIDRDDRGVHTLHLALGFVTVSIPGEKPVHAPLLLVPVNLEREGSRGRFRVVANGDDPVPNYALEVYLKTKLGIELSKLAPHTTESSAFNPTSHFEAIASALKDSPNIRIDRGKSALGLFSFEGVSLYNDLDPSNWPEGRSPIDSPTLHRLTDKNPIRSGTTNHLPTGDLSDHSVVVPVDPSQLRCVEHAVNGRDLVIYGPPGTGKSHTITAMIASLVAQGKKVLFVSQKAAALQVVDQNLHNIGLGDLSLVLHSDTMPRKDVIDSLKATLEQDPPRTAKLDEARAQMKAAQGALTAYAESVASPITGYGLTFHEAVGRQALSADLLAENADSKTIPGITLREGLSVAELDTALSLSQKLQDLLKKLNPISAHPFIGSTATTPLLPQARLDALASLTNAAGSVSSFQSALTSLCSALQLPVPESLQEVRLLLAALQNIRDNEEILSVLASVNLHLPGWQLRPGRPTEKLSPLEELTELRASLKGVVSEQAWAIPEPQSLVSRVEELRNDRFFFLKGDYWKLRSEIRSAYRAPKLFEKWESWLNVANKLSRADTLRSTLSSEPLNGFMGSLLTDSVWKGADTDLTLATRVATFCEEFVATHSKQAYFNRTTETIKDPASCGILREKLGELENLFESCCQQIRGAMQQIYISAEEANLQFNTQSLSEISARLNLMAPNVEELDEMGAVNRFCDTLSKAGVTLPPRALQEHGDRIASSLAAQIENVWATSAITAHAQAHATHQNVQGTDVVELCRRYLKARETLLVEHRHYIACEHWRRIPRGIQAGQAGYIQKEVEKKRNFRPIRELMRSAGGAVQSIKPVIMASPASVARFLSPESLLDFDAVIIDEGSQVPPEEALGPLARGAQMIIVGDSKQMPPSRLFSKSLDTDDESDLAAESVLDMAVRQGISPQMLTHHRRSRDPSLIELASRFHYQDKLQVTPSPMRNSKDQGLQLTRVENAVYDRGGTGTNKVEAGAIVDAIVQHVHDHPERSLGVVAFNIKQAEEILLQLEKRARDDERLSQFLQSEHSDHPFFVRSLENVQGDERDTIFVSVGFGYDEKRKFPMNFGPLNNQGGERRLNVLMTRARWECRVFSSFDPHDLRVEEAGLGLQHLKEYLLFAQSRSNSETLAEHARTTPARSAFARALQRKLAKQGLILEELGHTDGSADLAVVDPADPSRHALAIVLDGSQRADALPGAALPELNAALLSNGWKTHFVSTADLLYRPTQVVEEIVRLVRIPSNSNAEERSEASSELNRISTTSLPQVSPVIEYKRAEVVAAERVLELEQEKLARRLLDVIKLEAPIHTDELYFRLRAGERERVGWSHSFNSALQSLVSHGAVTMQEDFCFASKSADDCPIRDRGDFSPARKKIDYVHSTEINAAILYLTHATHGIEVTELAPATLAVLGLGRENDESLRAVEGYIAKLLTAGEIAEKSGFYTAARKGWTLYGGELIH